MLLVAVAVGGEVAVGGYETGGLVVVVGSLQPNQPGVLHVVVVDVSVGMVVVSVGAGVAEVVVVGSLQPNQPGVLHVEVVAVVVVGSEVVGPVVVVSSRHPHHPGVWQVDVLVGEDEVVEVVGAVVEVVVVSDPLLRKNFQSSQS